MADKGVNKGIYGWLCCSFGLLAAAVKGSKREISGQAVMTETSTEPHSHSFIVPNYRADWL